MQFLRRKRGFQPRCGVEKVILTRRAADRARRMKRAFRDEPNPAVRRKRRQRGFENLPAIAEIGA
jgi:hypothetical protein